MFNTNETVTRVIIAPKLELVCPSGAIWVALERGLGVGGG